MKIKLALLLLALLSVLAPQGALAYLSTYDNNNTLEAGQNRLGLEGQYIFTNISGGDLVAHYNYGLGNGQELKFVLGSGVVNFQAGAFYKFVPFPDTDTQPGVGGFVGLLYSNVSGQTITTVRFHPMVSKIFKFNDDHSMVTPYAALPIGISTGGTTTTPIQIAAGAEWLPTFFDNMRIMAEIGFNVNAAFSYFSAGLTVPFETFETLRLK